MPRIVRNNAIVGRRPNRSAMGGTRTQPMIVPIARTIEPYEAILAASAGALPARIAICVTAVGT